MSWSSWFGSGNGEAKSKSVSAKESRSGSKESHFLSTAGGGKHHKGGGDRSNHSHVIVQHREGRSTAHSVPHKKNR